jgi:integrase
MFNFAFLSSFHAAGKSMTTDPTEDGKPHKTSLLVMAGLPKSLLIKTNPILLQPEILSFIAKMKANNYSEQTIESYGRAVETLSKRGTDIFSVESIKTGIANYECSNRTKQNIRNAMILFLKYNGIDATIPKFKRIGKMVFIPLENELDQLIAGCKNQLATFLQVLKKTGARFGDALNIHWTTKHRSQHNINNTRKRKRSKNDKGKQQAIGNDNQTTTNKQKNIHIMQQRKVQEAHLW